MENQIGRRNLTDDQRAGIAERVRQRRSALATKERARAAGKTGGRNHPKFSLSDTVSDKLNAQKPKHDTRAAVAREAHVPERKVRAVQEVAAAKPELVDRIVAGEMTAREVRMERRAAAAHVSPSWHEIAVKVRQREVFCEV